MTIRRSSRRAPLGALALALYLAARGNTASGVESPRGAEGGQPVCLVWEAGTSSDCPSVEQIDAAIRAMVGHSLVSRGRCQTRVTAAFRPDASGGGRVDLHFASKTGEPLGDRSLEIPDATCSAFKDPLSLVIVLMVEDRGVESMAVHLPKPASAQLDATGSASMTALSIGGAVSSGLLPKVGFGATMGVASRVVGGLPLRLDTTVWFPIANTTSRPGGQLWAWLGGVGLCPSLLRTRRLTASACLRVLAGAIHGVGLTLDPIWTATRPFAAGELSAAILVRISREVSISVSAGGAASWVRPRFVYLDPEGRSVLIHQPNVLIPLAALGLQFGSDEARQEGARP